MKRRILLPVLLLLVGLNIYGNIGYLPKEWYDSSADYWRLTKDGKLVYDKSANLTIENADGTTKVISYEELARITGKKIGSDQAVQSSLAAILGISNDAAGKIMSEKMGMQNNASTQKDWTWHIMAAQSGTTDYSNGMPQTNNPMEINEGHGVNLKTLDRNTQATMINALFDSVYKNDANGVIENPGLMRNYYTTHQEAFSSRFLGLVSSEFNSRPQAEINSLLNNSGSGFKMQDGIYSKIASPEILKNYEQGSSWMKGFNPEASDDQTYCSSYVFDQTVLYNARAASVIFPNGFQDANAMQANFRNNRYMEFVTHQDAQDLANMGQLVYGSLLNPSGSGHVAFAVPQSTNFFTLNPFSGSPQNGNGYGFNFDGGWNSGLNVSYPVMLGVGIPKSTGPQTFGYTFGSDNKGSVLMYHFKGYR